MSQEDASSASPPKKISISGIYKVEKVGPVFKIVDSYERRKDAKFAAVQRLIKEGPDTEKEKREKGDLFADNRGPCWHQLKNPMITKPIITDNLSRQFESLPIYGAPESIDQLDNYQNKLIRQFVGCDLDDTEFEELENYCNPDMLKTGKELRMVTRIPVQGDISKNLVKDSKMYYDEDDDKLAAEEEPKNELIVLKKLRLRKRRDKNNLYSRSLKYRGTKLLSLTEQDSGPNKNLDPPDLEPGKDVVFRIRIYRPFTFVLSGEKQVRGRHSVFECELVMSGRQRLSELRDRFTCRNDLDLRLDLSQDPAHLCTTSAREVFPSGFLFINNVFYVDERVGCRDVSAAVRGWARARGMGEFPRRCMGDYALGDVLVKLAHPDVYVHQGSCEHVFLFSELRLLNRSDPLQLRAFPRHTALSQNQVIYCTTCAEFGAKWLVAGSTRVPFDPAFFCEVCFQKYLYVDNAKIGDFKAYAYKGNELNLKNVKNMLR